MFELETLVCVPVPPRPTAPKKFPPTDGVALSPCGSEPEWERGDLLRTCSAFFDRAGTLLEMVGPTISTALAKSSCAVSI